MPRVSKAVQEINQILTPDDLAKKIVNMYVTWRGANQTWRSDMKELRNYLFQTDTTETTNKQLPWKNKTSIPKLAQLRDNLHANYFAALFPNDNFFKWEADESDEQSRQTARVIEAYMKQKIRESNFKEMASDALYDYIDFGNAFGEVDYETEVHTTEEGNSVLKKAGPIAHRISPYDIVFDVTAPSFKDAAKITRRVVSVGTLKRAQELNPVGFAWVTEALDRTRTVRTHLSQFGDSDIDKSDGFVIDGFGSLSNYYSSDMVEILEFDGDLYDPTNDKLYANHRMLVIDRKSLVYNKPFESWLGTTNKVHVSWRPRPDNLMGMGPLDNLVGMQYRLDHLENLKADVFDQIAHPVVFQRGNIEDWDWGPGERIFGDEESDLQILRPDATVLNADFQMNVLMSNMEELAGAPKQAMGIRTPGEKTAFEIQALENAAGRIFQQKIERFEKQFLEPLLNQMLEAARRNLQTTETIKILDEDFAIQEFIQVTKEDLNKKGKLYPMGASHFAKRAQAVQNLLGLVNSAAYQDPAVATHISGKRIAELLEEFLGLEKFELVQDNIRIAESQETQSLVSLAQESVASEIMGRQELDDEAMASG